MYCVTNQPGATVTQQTATATLEPAGTASLVTVTSGSITLGVNPLATSVTIPVNCDGQNLTIIQAARNPPDSADINSGNGQNVQEGNPFTTPLTGTFNYSGVPVPNWPWTATVVPGPSGASGTFPGGVSTWQATTDSSGMFTLPKLTADNKPGIFTVTVTADGTTVQATFSLTISAPPISISYPEPLFTPETWTPINLTPTIAGNQTPAIWSVAPGSSLPIGLTLDSTTGVISGTQVVPGSNQVTIQATAGVQSGTTTVTFDEPNPIGAQFCTCGVRQDVAVASGEMAFSVTDMNAGGPSALTFERFHSSYMDANGGGSALGVNFSHSYNHTLSMGNAATTLSTRPLSYSLPVKTLYPALSPQPTATAKIRLPSGRIITFIEIGGPPWILLTPAQFDYQLVNVGNGQQFLDPETNLVYTFSAPVQTQSGLVGKLTAISDRNGNTLTITQGPFGPTLVVDGLGRSLSFTYNAQGQQGATYTITVSNAANAGATSGAVTVAENLPSGLSLASMAGSGWTCGTTGSCTRSDPLAGGGSYAAITVTVNVAANAASPQVRL